MKYLITGGCGFLGSNIASELLRQGQQVAILDSLYRYGSYQNLEWLRTQGDFDFIHADIRNANDVERVVNRLRPEFIYHLAGQVAMTTSIQDPRRDFEVNTVGSFNLLNAVRIYSPDSAVIYSSTNKVYGDLEQFTYEETETRYRCVEKPNGFDEKVGLDFHSPYGASKGAADQYMLDFARIYGLKTVVFRHSSMFGGRQFASEDQGWVGWFTQKAVEIKQGKLKEPFTISGNGKQVRDLLYASDAVELYLKAVDDIHSIKGKAYNIGGGLKNSSSLIELFNFLEDELDIKMNYINLKPRENDQKIFVADIGKAKHNIDWSPQVGKDKAICKMVEWVLQNSSS